MATIYSWRRLDFYGNYCIPGKRIGAFHVKRHVSIKQLCVQRTVTASCLLNYIFLDCLRENLLVDYLIRSRCYIRISDHHISLSVN